ncbi:MAG: DUF11 domain-containing protein [Anaerolineae bacterium]|nr:DUF11 domain-containing protein [Anaerolineae bacterium]
MMKSHQTQQAVLKSLALGALGALAIACLFLIQPAQSLLQDVDGAQAPNAVTITGGVYTDTTCTGTPIATDANPITPGSPMAFCYFLRNSGSYTFPTGYNVSDSDGPFVPPAGPFTVSVPITYADASTATTVDETRVITFSGLEPVGGVFVNTVVTKTFTAYVMKPSIIMTKTVGLSASCSTTTTLSPALGTAPINAVYCYRITNNGNVSVTITGIGDDRIPGVATAGSAIFPAVLPRNSSISPMLVAQIVNGNVTNTARVTATHLVPIAASPIFATAQASVTFSTPKPAIRLNVYVTTAADCTGATADTITVAPGTGVRFCYVATNIGNTPLYTHTLSVNGTTLFAGQLITLPIGGVTVYSQGPISVSGVIGGAPNTYPASWSAQEINGIPTDPGGFESASIYFANATATPTPRPSTGGATATPTPTQTPIVSPTPSTPTDIEASFSASSNGATGSVFSYTIRVLNKSTTTAGGLIFTNTLPSNATFQGVVRGSGVTCPTMPSVGDIGGTIICNITGTLVSGQFDELSVTVRPNNPTGSSLSTSVTASTTTSETNLANNTATLNAYIGPRQVFIPLTRN